MLQALLQSLPTKRMTTTAAASGNREIDQARNPPPPLCSARHPLCPYIFMTPLNSDPPPPPSPAPHLCALPQALSKDPSYTDALLEYAECLKWRGLYTESEFQLKKLLDSDPNLCKAWRNYGDLRLRAWDWDGALEAYSKARGVDPTDFMSCHYYCHLLYRLGRSAELKELLPEYTAMKRARSNRFNNPCGVQMYVETQLLCIVNTKWMQGVLWFIVGAAVASIAWAVPFVVSASKPCPQV